jgi:hypothetical protein
VQAANAAALPRDRQASLRDRRLESLRGELLRLPGNDELPALVREDVGLDERDSGNVGGVESH